MGDKEPLKQWILLHMLRNKRTALLIHTRLQIWALHRGQTVQQAEYLIERKLNATNICRGVDQLNCLCYWKRCVGEI
jgi:hypothetical protein